MRAIALLSISFLLAGCGDAASVMLTGKLTMSRLPADWCGFQNPDSIRMDCPFDLGIYAVESSADGGRGRVLQTVCVSMKADPKRTWATLSESLNQQGVRLDKIPSGIVRVEIAAIEPGKNNRCDYNTAVDSASLYGSSDPLPLTFGLAPNRFDISTKCRKTFSPSETCLR